MTPVINTYLILSATISLLLFSENMFQHITTWISTKQMCKKIKNNYILKSWTVSDHNGNYHMFIICLYICSNVILIIVIIWKQQLKMCLYFLFRCINIKFWVPFRSQLSKECLLFYNNNCKVLFSLTENPTKANDCMNVIKVSLWVFWHFFSWGFCFSFIYFLRR